MWTVQFRNFSVGLFPTELVAKGWATVNLRHKNWKVVKV